MDQDQLPQDLLFQLDRYQYSYAKPQPPLAQILANLPLNLYPFLYQYIADYDSLKIKRLLRFLKPDPSLPAIKLKLKHKIRITQPIPSEIVDLSEPYTLRQAHLIQSDQIADLIMTKLKEDYFVDTKVRSPNAFPFKSSYYGLLKDQHIDIIVELCVKLIKRSDQNLPTLETVLSELQATPYALKAHFIPLYEALQEHLKHDSALNCLLLAFKLIRDEATLQKASTLICKLLTGTLDEKKKYRYCQTLNPDPAIDNQIVEAIIHYAPYISDEIQVFTLAEKFNQTKGDITKYYVQLKKLVTINKFTNAFASLVVAHSVEQNKNELASKEFHDLIEQIFNSLSNNFKNFAKVVTQTTMFLAELKCILLYTLFFEDDAPPKLIIAMNEAINKNTSIFDSKSHLTQLKYLIAPSCQQESQLYLDTFILYLGSTFDLNEEFNYQLLQPVITLLAFSGKVKNSVNSKQSLAYLSLYQEKQDGLTHQQLYNNLFRTCHNYLYQINPNQGEGINFRKDRLTHFIAYVLTQTQEVYDPYFYFYTLSNNYISQKLLLKLPYLPFDFNPLIVLSKQGLKSNNPNTYESTLNLVKYLSKHTEITQPFLPVMNPANLLVLESLDQFEEELSKLQLFEYNTKDLTHSGLKTISDEKPVNQIELELQKELQKLQSTKAVMMDENEAKTELLKKQRQKMGEYFRTLLPIFQQHLGNEDFYAKYFDQLAQFAAETSCRHENLLFLLSYFESYQLTQRYKWELSEFFQERSFKQIPSDKTMKRINQFQEKLLARQAVEEKSLLIMIHLFNKYVIQQKSFDLSTKTRSFAIILQYQVQSEFYKTLVPEYFEPFLGNISICCHAKNSTEFLTLIFNKSPEHYEALFFDMLNLVPEAQNLILRVIKQVPDTFELNLKLRILAGQQETAELAGPFVTGPFESIKAIRQWNMEKFVKHSAREHLEAMIDILAAHKVDDCFCEIICSSALNLYRTLEDEQLEFFPYFILKFNQRLAQPAKVLDLLIKFSQDENKRNLIEQCIKAGRELINLHASKHLKDLLAALESNLQDKDSSVMAIIYLGQLSPFLQGQNQRKIQEQIMNMFRTQSKKTVINLAKSLEDLLVFFPNTENLILELIQQLKVEKEIANKSGLAYLIAGLARGLGVDTIEKLKLVDQFELKEERKKEPPEEKYTVLLQLEALIQTFGKVIEPYIIRVMKLLMRYFGDSKQEIRELAIASARVLMQSLTGYGVKIMLEPLLKGLDEDTQWRGKVANIWALGNMAYCSPKQLSQRLPAIVSSISKAISDTHPDVKQAANDSLNLIGSTIKNPEISSIADILIKSLSNPYDENLKGLKVILDTKFRHFIDAPAMSLLIPIIDYGLRAQDSVQRRLAAILIGGLPYLIETEADLVPYMDLITGGLDVVIGDALLEVRSVAARAVGQLSKKIGIENTRKYLKFVWETLESKEQSSNKRSGAAHAMAEISCAHGDQFLEQQLQHIYSKIKENQVHIKEGYIGIIVYMPSILQSKFENYVKEIIENVYECVSHEDDIVSSIALRVLKILIKNFGIVQNELLYPVLTSAMQDQDFKKRNGGVLLAGEMLKLTMRIVRAQLENPANPQIINIEMYYQNLMSLYILQQDVTEMIRQQAVAIWKEYIENTPKTIKRAIRSYIRQLCCLTVNKGTYTIASNSIRSFSEKYGETQLGEGFRHIGLLLEEESDKDIIRGCYQVLNLIYSFTTQDILLKYRDDFIQFSRQHITNSDQFIKKELFDSIQTMINKVKNTAFVELLVQPFLEDLAEMNEEDPKYGRYLEIFNRLCELKNPLILHYLVVLILVPPLYQYKVDILTINSLTFSQVVYKKYEGTKVPIQILFHDLFDCAEMNKKLEWLPRPQSLIYCLSQLASNIRAEVEDYLQMFVDNILNLLTTKSKPILELDKDSDRLFKYCVIPLEILEYFLANTTEEHQIFSQSIIEKVVPFLFLDSPYLNKAQHLKLYQFSSKILLTLNNTLEKQAHIENMKNVHTCFFNRPDQAIPGLNIDEGAEPYVAMIVDTIVFATDEFFNYAIQFLHLLIKRTNPDVLQSQILKLVGSLIRIINYKIPAINKMKALDVINEAQKKLNIDQFKPQLVISYDKIVIEINNVERGLKQLSLNYSNLLRKHEKKDYLINQLFNRGISGQTLEARECHFRVVKKAVKDAAASPTQIYSSAVMERFFVLGKQAFDRCIKVSEVERVSAVEANLLGQILALTYKYTNKNNKDHYVSQFLKTDEYYLFLLLQFSRFHNGELMTEQVVTKTIEQINTCEDGGYVVVLLKQCRKIPQLNGLRPKLKPKQNENPRILMALSLL